MRGQTRPKKRDTQMRLLWAKTWAWTLCVVKKVRSLAESSFGVRSRPPPSPSRKAVAGETFLRRGRDSPRSPVLQPETLSDSGAVTSVWRAQTYGRVSMPLRRRPEERGTAISRAASPVGLPLEWVRPRRAEGVRPAEKGRA